MCLGSGKYREWGVSGAIISTSVAILKAAGQSYIIPAFGNTPIPPSPLVLPGENNKQNKSWGIDCVLVVHAQKCRRPVPLHKEPPLNLVLVFSASFPPEFPSDKSSGNNSHCSFNVMTSLTPPFAC